MTRVVKMITTINVPPELWACYILPEGIIESWQRPNGSPVEAGDPVAVVRIENALHELMAPARGRLEIGLKVNSVFEPGTEIGSITRHLPNI